MAQSLAAVRRWVGFATNRSTLTCGADGSATVLDLIGASGNPNRGADVDGTKTCRGVDNGHLETATAEGLAASGADCRLQAPAGSSLPAGSRKVCTP